MPIDRKYGAEQIELLVAGGFYDAEQIERIVLDDCFLPQDVTEDDVIWVGKEVERMWCAKQEEEKSWPAVTDWDKLDAAFAKLSAAGIITSHQAGMEPSDGLTEVAEAYHARGAEHSGVVGYCFYHRQDVDAAIKGHGLMLAFGDISGDPIKGVEIGRRITAALEQVGLRTSWNNNVEQCIGIENLRWQKRYRPRSE